MMNISASIVNMPDFLRGVSEADKKSLQFMRRELGRGLKRLRKKFITEQLKGPPGIRASGRLSKGRNVFTFVKGETHADLSGHIGISSLLHVHEKGATIRPRASTGMLYLKRRGRGSPKGGVIFAVVPQVVIPKRLHFQTLVNQEAPQILVRVAHAGQKGVEVAMSNALKRTVKKI